eukprot:583725-Pleurochrysis_carterae.AAC.5
MESHLVVTSFALHSEAADPGSFRQSGVPRLSQLAKMVDSPRGGPAASLNIGSVHTALYQERQHLRLCLELHESLCREQEERIAALERESASAAGGASARACRQLEQEVRGMTVLSMRRAGSWQADECLLGGGSNGDVLLADVSAARAAQRRAEAALAEQRLVSAAAVEQAAQAVAKLQAAKQEAEAAKAAARAEVDAALASATQAREEMESAAALFRIMTHSHSSTLPTHRSSQQAAKGDEKLELETLSAESELTRAIASATQKCSTFSIPAEMEDSFEPHGSLLRSAMRALAGEVRDDEAPHAAFDCVQADGCPVQDFAAIVTAPERESRLPMADPSIAQSKAQYEHLPISAAAMSTADCDEDALQLGMASEGLESGPASNAFEENVEDCSCLRASDNNELSCDAPVKQNRWRFDDCIPQHFAEYTEAASVKALIRDMSVRAVHDGATRALATAEDASSTLNIAAAREALAKLEESSSPTVCVGGRICSLTEGDHERMTSVGSSASAKTATVANGRLVNTDGVTEEAPQVTQQVESQEIHEETYITKEGESDLSSRDNTKKQRYWKTGTVCTTAAAASKVSQQDAQARNRRGEDGIWRARAASKASAADAPAMSEARAVEAEKAAAAAQAEVER